MSSKRRSMGLFIASALAFALAPFLVSNYWLYWICLIAINVISATGLNILTGYTGLASLGQAAFMGVGAYTVALLQHYLPMPFPLALLAAGLVAATIGLLVGVPSLRVKGLYLAIATLAASVVLEFVFVNWESVTNGTKGLTLSPATFFGHALDQPAALYWVIVPTAIALVAMASNLFRTRVGRAFIAIRDRDISAEVLGIPLLRYKLMSFGLSSFYAGIAGGLWAYFFRVVTPDAFPIVMSIFFLAAIIVGGLGSISGGVIGAIFMTLVPEVLRLVFGLFTDWIPDAMAFIPSVRSIIFGTLIIGFLLFEPQGIVAIFSRLRTLRPGGRKG
ncbi:MAG: branched-chain amino acid ABC transporter permease [Ottowia sp.]|uniref:branched-chain amino acid ABC transporter permease n=1 Tax=Ottowia sp. TaxID=1898956 RepID=UPI003C76C60A